MDKPTKLNKTFTSGSTLYADELNLLTSKIDEIIDAFNNLPTTSTQIINNTPTDYSEEIAFLKNVLSEICPNYESGDYSISLPKIIASITYENGDLKTLKSQIKISADNVILDGDTTILGYLNANYAKIDQIETSHISASGDSLIIGSGGGYSEIYFDVSGNSDHNNTTISISNDTGLMIQCDENTGNETGFIRIGNAGGKFGIYTSHSAPANSASYASGSGVGFTGVINGARFVNGICIGPLTIQGS